MTALDVTFVGCSERHGGLTWAQRDICGFVYGGAGQGNYYQARNATPDLYGVIDPVADVSLDTCLHVLQALVRRHEALRTTFVRDADGFSGQRVHSDGTISVHVDRIGSPGPDQAASKMFERLATSAIDVVSELPLRVGLVTDAGAVCRVVLGASRMVVDGWGTENFLQQVRGALTEPELLRQPQPPGFHQLDQWMWEESTNGKMRAEAALDYRRRLLMQGNGSYGSTSIRPVRQMRLGTQSFDSGLTAARKIARGMSASLSAVLFASCARAISKVLGSETLTVLVHCANRFGSPREESVTRLKGMALVRYAATSESLEHEVKQVSRALLIAYRHAQLPPDEGAALMRRSKLPPLLEFNDRCPINDRVAEDGRLGAAPMVDSASDVTLIDSGRASGNPHIGLTIDPKDNRGLTIKLESNVLTDDEIVAALDLTGTVFEKSVLRA